MRSIFTLYSKLLNDFTRGDKLKAKIERFSNGDFEYEQPYLCLSEEKIEIAVETGKIKEGKFIVSNSKGRIMRGRVYSTNRLMQIKNPDFEAVENTIHYHFNAVYLREGELISGEFCIISDCGEEIIPYTLKLENVYYHSSLGKIKDLFQFTNLARVDWSEAKKVFRSEDFEKIFLENEDRYRFVYRNLIKSISTSQALEEFLIVIRKKAAIRLEIDKNKVEYQTVNGNITDKLILTKNNWGYAEIRVSTDADFIQLEQKFLWADRFIGNSHQITYGIDFNKLKFGNNYGHIFIKTTHQTIVVNVYCKHRKEAVRFTEKRALQRVELEMVDNYMSFRLNRIGLAQFLEDEEMLIKKLPGPEVNRYKELMKIHFSILTGRTKLAEELLDDIESDAVLLRRKSTFEYCSYLYLKALYSKDERIVSQSTEIIRSCYENANRDWRIQWFLLYLDKQYEKNKDKKLMDIKEQFDSGCRSPIMYYEAVCIYNEVPFLLRDLKEFEIQVLNFGIKNWILSKEVSRQFVYLTEKKKRFDPIVFSGLCKLYDEYETKEILSAICCCLIKGAKKSNRYFEWYRLGVEAQLRITELYEYYMYSIDASIQDVIAQPVLLYFVYNSNLSDKKKAFLYANIIKNKNKLESIYRTYYRRMEVFTYKMLESHQISRDLAILYDEFIGKNLLNEALAEHLPFIIYRNELVCNNSNMVNVIVIHKELALEETFALVDGKAQINIFTDNKLIMLSDGFGNRFVESAEYTTIPYMSFDLYESFCLNYSNHPMLLLHSFNNLQKYRIMSHTSIDIRKRVLLIEGLGSEYETASLMSLIEYYYENYNNELLEHYLEQIDLKLVSRGEQIRLLEFLLIHNFIDKAMVAISILGMEGLPINRLLKLCSVMINATDMLVSQEDLLDLCYYVFSHRKYNEPVLKYLIEFYEGSIIEMLRLWQSAKGFELDTHLLEERILTRILNTERNKESSIRVFLNYYRGITNHILVRAYLTYFAQRYLVHGDEIDSNIIAIMKRELHYEENDICLLAWLKYHAMVQNMSDNELVFTEYNIAKLVHKGIILPFFLEYQNKINLPDRILNRCFITYCSDPGKQVYLHYKLTSNAEQNYLVERMPNILLGIHVKEFILFYLETIQYYFAEESETESYTTDTYEMKYDNLPSHKGESNYQQLNQMLLAMETRDNNNLERLIENYVKKELMIAACFKQID